MDNKNIYKPINNASLVELDRRLSQFDIVIGLNIYVDSIKVGCI